MIFTYQSPQGATDNTPFPTGANRFIYAQEVNNMFEQVRQHINGSIGPDNFDLPFTSEVSFNLTTGSALPIVTASGANAISVQHGSAALGAGVSLFELVSTASNTNNNSALATIDQQGVSATIPLLRLIQRETTLPAPIVQVSDDGTAINWSLARAAASIEYDAATGYSHKFKVNDVEVFDIEAAGITSAQVIDAPSFTAGSSTFTDESLDLNGPVLSREDADTIIVASKLRINEINGPILSLNAGVNNELLVQNSIIFEETANGPRLLRSSANTLEVQRAIRLSDTADAVTLTPALNRLNVNSDYILANNKAAIVGNALSPQITVTGVYQMSSNQFLERDGTPQTNYQGLTGVAFGGIGDFQINFGALIANTGSDRVTVQITPELIGGGEADLVVAKITEVNQGAGFVRGVAYQYNPGGQGNTPGDHSSFVKLDFRLHVTISGPRL